MALPAPAPDRTALVTGASSGIGVELARELARRGHGLTLVARREAELRTLADELATAHGVRTEVVTADLAAPDSRVRAAGRGGRSRPDDRRADQQRGPVRPPGPVHRSDVDAELRMVRVDVEAVLELCSRVLPGMVERGPGAILNVASVAAFQPLPGQAGYGGVEGLRARLHRRAPRRAGRHRGRPPRRCAPVRSTRASARPPASARRTARARCPGSCGRRPRTSPGPGIAGLDRGRSVVIPGAANRSAPTPAASSPRASSSRSSPASTRPCAD